MGDLDDALRPSGWKCYPLYGPPTAASPTGGWFLDDDEIGFPFLERVRASRAPVVAVHKGLGGPIPSASVAAASPRDIGPAAAAFPDVTFLVYHSGYERDPDGEEGAYDPDECLRVSTAWCAASPTPASDPARTCTPSSAAPGTSCSAGRSRPRTCWASCCARSGPIASCGAPTRSGTGHPSR